LTLIDAGPLVALVDAGEPDHERCRETLDVLPLPLTTSWPAFTEAIYLLGRAAGWPAQEALWKLVDRGILKLADLTPELTARAADLMRRYQDHPMDLADATLVALAEYRGDKLILSLDAHFRSYELRGRRHLRVIPD
jgi:predicted nucleic acid-binding protein